MSKQYQYSYVGRSTKPQHVLGQIVAKAGSRHSTVLVDGEEVEVTDRVVTTDVEEALRLEASPQFKRVPGTPKPKPPAAEQADEASDPPAGDGGDGETTTTTEA